MREYLISILNRAEHIIKKKKREREKKKEGRLFLDEGGLLNRGISLYTIQHSRFNYFPTQMKRGGGGANTDLFVSWETMQAFET